MKDASHTFRKKDEQDPKLVLRNKQLPTGYQQQVNISSANLTVPEKNSQLDTNGENGKEFGLIDIMGGKR